MNKPVNDSIHAYQYHVSSASVRAAIEAQRGRVMYGPHHSFHEGYAVLKEEVEELWDEIKLKESDPEKIEREAIQVAAMAIRIAIIARRTVLENKSKEIKS